MLDFMRRKAQSPYLQATVLVIIVVFVFWGGSSNFGRGGGANIVAEVNNEKISLEEYQRTYDRTYKKLSDQFGGVIPEQFLETYNLKNAVVEQLVQAALVRQASFESGVTVGDKEVQDQIMKNEAFRTGDRFDKNLFQEILRGSRIAEADYVESVRLEMLGAKIGGHMARFAKFSPQEVQDRFNYDNEEVKFEYVSFAAPDFKAGVTVNDADLAGYFEENKAKYMTLPKIKLKLLRFFFADAAKDVQIAVADLAEYYQKNIDAFYSPEGREARHILIRTSDSDTAEEKANKRKQAEAILAKVKAGKDFSDLAREFSEDGSAPQGGKLGRIEREQTVKPFDDALFALEVGQVSDIVTTQFGFHIIKLDIIEAASTRDFESVKDSIKVNLQKEREKALAFKAANEGYEKIILTGSLTKYAETAASGVVETDFFSRTEQPEGFPDDPALKSAAFQLTKGELSSLVEGAKGYYIFYVEDMLSPEVPPLALVKDQVQKDFIATRADDLALKAASDMLASGKEGKSFSEIAKGQKKEVKESEFVSRVKKASKGVPGPVVDAGLELSGDSPYPEEALAAGGSYYVLRFKERKAPDQAVFAEKKNTLEQSLRQENEAAIYSAWVEYLRVRAKVAINEQYL